MARTNKAVKTDERHSWRDGAGMDGTGDIAASKHAVARARARTVLIAVNVRFAARAGKIVPPPVDTSPPAAGPDHLSVRAENVLKELAAEIAGDSPPEGTMDSARWPAAEIDLQASQDRAKLRPSNRR